MPPCKWCITLIPHKPLLYYRPATIRPSCLARSHSSVVQTDSPDTKPQSRHLLNALYRTNAILPKAFPANNAAAWSALLKKSGEILLDVTSHMPRIAVLSLDRFSRPHEVVSALLDNPLLSDQATIRALRSHEIFDNSFVVSYGQLQQSHSALTLDVPVLRTWDSEIVEIPAEHPDPIPLLYDADIQLLVATLRTPALLPSLLPIFRKPGVFLVLRYPTFDQQVVDQTVSSLTEFDPAVSEIIKGKVIHLYPPKAFSAVDLFRKDPTSSYTIQKFQDDYNSSGVPSLSNSISAILQTDSQILKANYSECILDGALHACSDAAALAMHDVAAVQSSVDNMRSQVLRTKDIINDIALSEKVVESLQRATKMMLPVMDAIPWWRLPFMVDDLNHHITSATERVWCRDLQGMLQFQSGRLSILQSQLALDTFVMVNNSPSSFHSALLLNELEQISCQPPPIGPTALTYPISYRLQQLQEPTIKLHRCAQRSTFLLSFGILGSWGSAYSAWLLDTITPSTALGLGSLGFVLALRWFVGQWDRAKAKWWQDWARVGEGLRNDLPEALSLVITEKVTSMPMKAINELENMADVKKSDATTLLMDLDVIKTGLRDQHAPLSELSSQTDLEQKRNP